MIKLNLNSIEAEQHFLAVKNLIQNRIRNVIALNYVGRNPNRINLTPNTILFLNDLLNDVSLKNLIVSSPADLLNTIAFIRVNYPDFIIPNSPENLILRNIFIAHCYDNKLFVKLDFITRINVDTCPYCNRNYIYYLSKASEIKPQIDHFYPKSIYPFLAASFYNLIPSCQTCNGFGAKEEKDPIIEGLVNPYLIENDSFKFTYKIKSINFLNPLLDKRSVDVKFLNKIQGHLNVFKLDRLYDQHTDHVLELVIKSKVAYSEKYREYLHTYKGLKFNDNEIDRMILGNYSKQEEIHKRPLAKMYQDIGRELGLIK